MCKTGTIQQIAIVSTALSLGSCFTAQVGTHIEHVASMVHVCHISGPTALHATLLHVPTAALPLLQYYKCNWSFLQYDTTFKKVKRHIMSPAASRRIGVAISGKIGAPCSDATQSQRAHVVRGVLSHFGPDDPAIEEQQG